MKYLTPKLDSLWSGPTLSDAVASPYELMLVLHSISDWQATFISSWGQPTQQSAERRPNNPLPLVIALRNWSSSIVLIINSTNHGSDSSQSCVRHLRHSVPSQLQRTLGRGTSRGFS